MDPAAIAQFIREMKAMHAKEKAIARAIRDWDKKLKKLKRLPNCHHF